MPIHITHSRLFSQFFETKTCDPKPSNENNRRLQMDLIETSTRDEALSSFSDVYDDEDERELMDDDDDDDDENNSLNNHNTNNEYEFEIDSDNSRIMLNDDEKRRQDEDQSGLWWDEDDALNELTLCGASATASGHMMDAFNLEELIENYELELKMN